MTPFAVRPNSVEKVLVRTVRSWTKPVGTANFCPPRKFSLLSRPSSR
jgi:hypothetical protein